MMMNDLREIKTPASAETGTAGKIVVAIAVVLGFGAIGTYAFEMGSANTQPKQAVASDSVSSPAPQLSALPETPPPAHSTADLSPPPVKDAPAQTSPQAAPPQIKLARAQAPAPVVREAKAVEAPKEISAPASPEIAAPAETVPEKTAPQETSVTPPANAPAESAPAQDAPAP